MILVVGDAADPPARLPLPPSTRSHRASRPSTVVANTPRVRGSGPLSRPPSPPGHPASRHPPMRHQTTSPMTRRPVTRRRPGTPPPPLDWRLRRTLSHQSMDRTNSWFGSSARARACCSASPLTRASRSRPAPHGRGDPAARLPGRASPSLKLDREAATRKATLVRTGDLDILLQELNALTMLDERALEAADAELALRAAESLSETMREATTNAETSDVGAQRTRLLERRRTQAEFQEKLLRRKVVEGKLQAQSQWVVYGAALGASVLSTVVMHPRGHRQGEKTSREDDDEDDDPHGTTTHAFGGPARGERSDISDKSDKNAGAGGGGRGDADGDEGGEARKSRTLRSRRVHPPRSIHPPLTVPVDIFAPLGVPMTPAGIASLYDGLLADVVKEGPPLALYLGIYEALKTAFLATDLQSSPVTCYLLAGAFGELAGSVLRVPAEAVKSTQQSDASLTLRDALEVNFATAEGRANCVVAWRAAVTRGRALRRGANRHLRGVEGDSRGDRGFAAGRRFVPG